MGAARVGLIGAAVVLLGACRLTGAASPGSYNPSTLPSASVLAASWPPSGITITLLDSRGNRGLFVTSLDGCSNLRSEFMRDWCDLFLGPEITTDPKFVAGKTLETPENYAWLAQQLVADLDGFCQEPFVLFWYSLSPRPVPPPSGQTPEPAAAECADYVSTIRSDGYFKVSGPGTVDALPVEDTVEVTSPEFR